jgi:DNA primase
MSGRIPQTFINDLLGRVDIVDVIDARLTLKKAGKNYKGLCPFHNEKSPSFSVSPDKQFYHCFGCGASGTALTFLMEFDRMEFVEAVESLARLAGVEVPREQNARPQNDQSDLYAALAAAERFFRASLKASTEAIDYLKGRGLTGETARDFGIGYAPDSWDGLRKALAQVPESRLLEVGLLTRNDKGRTYDRFRGRVMFPIRDTRGRIIGFGGRVLGSTDGPKYLNSPETPLFHKGRELYGLYEARRALRQLDRLVVVEGYMDVVALAQAGIANAVATLGTAATGEHFQKLYRYTEEVVCCFDGDAAGRQAAWRALESALPTLADGRQLKFVFLPDGEDPDSLVRQDGREALQSLVAGAQPAIEYLFNRLAEGLDLSSLDGQARLASLAAPHIEQVPAGVLRQLMLNRLHAITGLKPPGGASAAPRPGSARPGSARPAAGPAGGGARLSTLSRRLLSGLLRKPAMLHGLPTETRAALSGTAGPDLFLEIVNYIDQNPGVDTTEILGRWSGTEDHRALLGMLEQPMPLDDTALQGEFADGVDRYLALREQSDRRRLLAEMRQDPSREKFQAFWHARHRTGAAAEEGDSS